MQTPSKYLKFETSIPESTENFGSVGTMASWWSGTSHTPCAFDRDASSRCCEGKRYSGDLVRCRRERSIVPFTPQVSPSDRLARLSRSMPAPDHSGIHHLFLSPNFLCCDLANPWAVTGLGDVGWSGNGWLREGVQPMCFWQGLISQWVV
ncbi:hypothetical protein JTB14_027361 [Gonioctena quinquepunctata]|nr:hypothetical protein JTB14_027361 [Gonioctena quinquepunctata]